MSSNSGARGNPQEETTRYRLVRRTQEHETSNRKEARLLRMAIQTYIGDWAPVSAAVWRRWLAPRRNQARRRNLPSSRRTPVPKSQSAPPLRVEPSPRRRHLVLRVNPQLVRVAPRQCFTYFTNVHRFRREWLRHESTPLRLVAACLPACLPACQKPRHTQFIYTALISALQTCLATNTSGRCNRRIPLRGCRIAVGHIPRLLTHVSERRPAETDWKNT